MSGGSKDKDHSVQDGSANSEVNKSTNESEEEVHTCPLCESELDAPLSDEIITEHVQLVLEALEDSRSSEVNEEEEEADEDNSPE
jgi:DNA repair exonuclease SbcCD ATPase subunit